MIARRRRRREDDAIDSHLAKPFYLIEVDRTAEARRDGDLQRRGPMMLALQLAQPLDDALDFRHLFAYAVPSVAQLRGPLQRRLGMPSEDDRRMRLLHRLRIHPESLDAGGLAMEHRVVFRP